ncbi:MAG: phosphatidylserine/phosphatidylglycerophosphate/cardiolipin synthase family protein [Deltaproteobacteria bacterium]|nr:phosphatidylserine/phosphatidylglycerophosphate/cardiolipin synthase family protein [Deltaproteobacteria bacterium]
MPVTTRPAPSTVVTTPTTAATVTTTGGTITATGNGATTTPTGGGTFDPNAGTSQPLPSGPTLGSTTALALQAARLGVDPALIARLANPAELKKTVEGFMQLVIATDGAAITKKQEQQIWRTLAALSAAGQLTPAVTMLVDQAAAGGALPAGLPPEKKQSLIEQFAALIEAEIAARGANGKKEGRFPSWAALSKRHLAAARKTQVPPKGPGNPSAFLDPRFQAELEKLTGAKMSGGNTVTPLIDGPASFAERDRLIDSATTSIHLMSWAIYDDVCGADTTKRLIAAKQRGVDVKIMVDGAVARQPDKQAMLKQLEAAGIEVVRWHDPQRVHDGQHRKVMIVDGKAAIAGGMNVGDVYSHKGPAGSQKWRDTDVKIEGPAVDDCARLFAQVWNEQRQQRNLTVAAVVEPPAPARATFAAGQKPAGLAQVVNDAPGPKGNAHILLAALKAIEGATTRIDIENAYFITTPALQDAILAALKRGVEVRILTNSPQSVDEPIVSAPIQESLPSLIAAGAKVYVKQGDTLHSKFLVVDELFSMVKSYNLHPRSERYEGEMSVNALDEATAKALTAAFAADIAKAKHLAQPSDVQVPKTAFSILAKRFFFDQL